MKKLLHVAAAAAALAAATPASAQTYGYPSSHGYSAYDGSDAPAGARAQVTRRTRAGNPRAPSSPYILGGQPYRGSDPDAFVRDYMRADPLGAQD